MLETSKAASDALPPRDTSRDGLRNTIENYILTRFRPLWSFVNGQPWLARLVNRVLVDNAVLKAPVRPLRLSTMRPYTSWESLTDRTWFSRYRPSRTKPDLPSIDEVATLFRVRAEGPRLSRRSTLLFPCFAQWFTDGFLMTGEDRRRTRTNHQIDLGQIYGLDVEATQALRLGSEAGGRKGRMKSDTLGSEEWAPKLYGPDGSRRAEFQTVPDPVHLTPDLPQLRKASLFAFGGERANSTLFTAAINTLFLREHNRLAAGIESANPSWDDQRVFDTARNINIVLLIKVVVQDYINHISPYWFRLLSDPTPSYTARWNRENWIPVEFNLLYRWHSLIPDAVLWQGRPLSMADTRFDNRLLMSDGLGAAFDSASRSAAWQIGLFNTSEMLIEVEKLSLLQGRRNQLASYNDYRETMRYPRVDRFEQISRDPAIVAGLRRLYGQVDRIEFFVGLFAEEVPERSAVPPLIGRMVAADAFSHALTNPLLSPQVFNEDTFTRDGMATIAATSTLMDIVARNLPNGARDIRVTMEQPGQPSFA